MHTSIDFNEKKGFICDMDGVIYHGNRILPGVAEFIDWLHEEDKEYLFLTNNSGYTPRELNQKLARMGLDVPEEHFYTSALKPFFALKSREANGSIGWFPPFIVDGTIIPCDGSTVYRKTVKFSCLSSSLRRSCLASDAELVSDHGDELEAGPDGIQVAPVPGHLDGVADRPLDAGRRGVVASCDRRI